MTNDTQLILPDLKIYFLSHRAGINVDQIPKLLVSFIDGANNTLDCAIYDLKHEAVLAAFKKGKDRGVKIRLGYDGGKTKAVSGGNVDPKPAGTTDAIDKAGLAGIATPLHSTGSHLMHDKFIVRDGKSVWTGSGNFTHGGLELQDNNFLILDSPDLAKTYALVLTNMLSDQHVHTGKMSGKPSPVSGKQVALGKVSVTPYFTTGTGEVENVETGVVAALKSAKRIRIAAMLISDPNILESLFAFSKPGSDIKGVLDPGEMKQVMPPPQGKSKQDPKFFWFANGDKRFVAAPSKPYHPGDTNDFMHNKFMVLDDRVVTGSYNFSENAESNDENLLVIKSPEVAAAYNAYFDKLFEQYTKHGAPLPPK